jgi:hypothetical protein
MFSSGDEWLPPSTLQAVDAFMPKSELSGKVDIFTKNERIVSKGTVSPED